MRAAIALPLLLMLATVLAAAPQPMYHHVPLRVEPAQDVSAIVIRSSDGVHSVVVQNGKALVPRDTPLPWVIGQTRFEATTYTEADLEQRRPLILRELGVLSGVLARPTAQGEKLVWLLQRSDSDAVQEVEFSPRSDGNFELRAAAGLYQGALIGNAGATRIRSGIIIKPGQATKLGTVAFEPTASVSVRVMNANATGAIAGARVVWDPPGEVLNSGLSRALFARRWSAITDARGMAVVRSVGPLPMSVRWRVEANGYAPARTTQIQVKEQQRLALPDVRLRPEALVVVRVLLPRGDDAFDDATLNIGEMQNERLRRFTGVLRADLHEGDTTFRVRTYGRKRVSVTNDSGKTLYYKDFDVTAERTLVDLQPQTIDIHGRVTRGDLPVAGTFIRLNDPQDSTVLLAQEKSDAEGEYRLRTYQDGELMLYTVDPGGPGKKVGFAAETLHADPGGDYRLDFKLPRSGATIVVVDASTGVPVRANVESLISLGGDRRTQGAGDRTDEGGRLELAGYPDGTAKLYIRAKGYQGRAIDIPIDENVRETLVRLEPSPEVRGRVVDVHGAPIPRARVEGGYDSEMQMNGHFLTLTDGDGRFTLDATPPPGTTFYVMAARHALGITYLQPGRENVIVLHPPSPGVVTLMPDNAPPSKVYMVMAAPAGGELIPLGALDDLADMNGMNPYQLQGSALDGTVVLPEFLGPGSYELFIALRGGSPYIYHRVGTVNAPIGRNVALAYKSR